MVVPFDNLSPEGTHGWVGNAIAESLSSHLRLVRHDVVSPEDRQELLRQKGIENGAPLTLAVLMEIGKESGADRVVMGSFRGKDGRLEITAQVIDVATGDKLGVIEDYGKLEDLVEIENQLAKNLLRLEGGRVPEAHRLAVERRKALPLEAYEDYVRAKIVDSPTKRRELLEGALAIYPDFADAALLFGQVLLEQDDLERAIEVLSTIPPEDPVYREAYFTMGVAYLEADRTRLAVEIFTRLSEQEKAACFLNNLAVAYFRRGELEEAVGTFREAAELEPSTEPYPFNMGWSAWRSERQHEARHWLTTATQIEPKDAEAFFLLSLIAADADDPGEAARQRGMALSLSPELAEIDEDSVGSVERAVERLPHALANYRFSASPPAPPGPGGNDPVENDPVAEAPEPQDETVDDPEKILETARSLRESGDLHGAARQLERAVYLDPHSVGIRLELAEVYRDVGELDKAASELHVLLWNREDAPTHLRLAEVYEAKGELDMALIHAEKAATLDQEDQSTQEFLER
ncbi:MAG: tetratricopeptide repeat protein, partial [Vicinamibacteria bacterium]